MEFRNERRKPPPWITPSAGLVDREPRPVIIIPRRTALYDPDAANYFSRVEAADGQTIGEEWKTIVNDLFISLKSGGHLSRMLSAALLCGPRTMTTIVPLLPTMPTPVRAGTLTSFTYNRKTGLSGGGVGYINTNLNDSAMGLNDVHQAAHITSGLAGMGVLVTNGTLISNGGFRNRTSSPVASATGTGFFAHARNNSANYVTNVGGNNSTVTATSTTRENLSHFVLARNTNGSPALLTTGLHTFFSIGTGVGLDLIGFRTVYLTYFNALQSLTLT